MNEEILKQANKLSNDIKSKEEEIATCNDALNVLEEEDYFFVRIGTGLNDYDIEKYEVKTLFEMRKEKAKEELTELREKFKIL